MANANRQFHVTDAPTLHALVRAQPLATLVMAHAGALHANHVPLFLDLASRAGWRVNSYTDAAVGTMAPDAQGRLIVSHVQLRPVTVFDAARAPTAAVLADLHHQAHAACFLANSVKTQIDCAPVLQTEGA